MSRTLWWIVFVYMAIANVCCKWHTPQGRNPFVKVKCVKNTWFLCGGSIYRLDSNAASWSAVGSGYDYDDLDFTPAMRYMVDFVTADVAFHAFNNRGMMRSVDGGRTWSKVSDGIITGVWFVDPKYGFFTDHEGHLHRTQDGGLTNHVVSDLRVVAVDVSDKQNVYISTQSDVFNSSDRGSSWTLLRHFESVISGIRHTESDLWVLGYKGYCSQFSLNDGKWTEWNLDSPSTLFDVCVHDRTALIVGSDSTLFSIDLSTGKSRKIPVDLHTDLFSVDVADDGTAIAVGGRMSRSLLYGWPSRTILKSNGNYRDWQTLGVN